MNKNIEFLQNELIRVTEWLKFAETKLVLISAYFTLSITFISTKGKEILSIFNESSILNYVSFVIILLFIISLLGGIYMVFRVVFPNITNLNTNKSFFFFGNISQMKVIDFINEYKELTDEQKEVQILEQIYSNSVITNEKFVNIKKASKFLFGNLIILLLLIFFL